MRRLYLNINSCQECPYSNYNRLREGYECKLGNFIIDHHPPTKRNIDNRCPLPEIVEIEDKDHPDLEDLIAMLESKKEKKTQEDIDEINAWKATRIKK